MPDTTKCSFCGKENKAEAIECEGCGEFLFEEISVVLTSAGADKIAVLKEIRNITGLGLRESKKIVDTAPCTIKDGLNKSKAIALKNALEDVGATVEFKKAEHKIESKEEIQRETHNQSSEKDNDGKTEYLKQNNSIVFKIIKNLTVIISVLVAFRFGFEHGFWSGLLAYILALIFFYLYFLPTHIASNKDHHHTTAICLLNILITNWPILFIWALCLKSNVPNGYKVVEPKSLAEKIEENVEKLGGQVSEKISDGCKKFDKKANEKSDQLIEKYNLARELNPEKYKKIDKFVKWGYGIFLTLIFGIATFAVIDAKIHDVNANSTDYYEQAKLISEEDGTSFVDDYAIAQKGDKYGLVDKNNKFVVKPIYANAQNIEGDYFFVCKDPDGEKCAYMNKITKKLLTDFKYIGCGNSWRSDGFSEGLAMVVVGKSDNFKVGYINKSGEEVIPPKYIDGQNFKNGVAEVTTKDGNIIKIDKKGNIKND